MMTERSRVDAAIIAKGLAYESNGSVYMDIGKFRQRGHAYPKLEPSKGKATEAEMAESEGMHKAAAGEKRLLITLDI